ncbi:MAG: hypothetical protein WBG19_06870 [Thermoplasmata archaeon]
MTADHAQGMNRTRPIGRNLIGSLRLRIQVSIGAAVGWISFTLLYLAFWARGFDLLQSVVVGVVSLLALAAILLGTWVSFGMSFAEPWFD